MVSFKSNPLIRIFLLIFFMVCSMEFAYAHENNGVLYRVDTRGPDEIFNQGFQSFGNNYSLRDHSRGTSCVGMNRNSGFISTSADPIYAANYARRLTQHTNSPVYVYIITSSSNMYNMAQSLQNISYSAGIHDANTQSEWIAVDRISSSQIRGVRAYVGVETPPVQPNPHFVDPQSVVNTVPYIENGTEDGINPAQAFYVSARPSITAGLAASLYCLRASNRAMNSQCGYLENFFTMTDRKKTSHFIRTVSSPGLFFPIHGNINKWIDIDGLGNLSYCGFGTDANSDRLNITCLRNLGDFYFQKSIVSLSDYGWAAGRAFTDADGDGKTDYCRLQYTWTEPVCSLSKSGMPFSENKNGPYVNGGYDDTRSWIEDKPSKFCRQTSGTETVCSDFTGENTSTFTDSDSGWSDSRMWLDVDNNGKSDYCRLIYTYTHLRCNLNKIDTWKTVETGYVDGGYYDLRFNIKMSYTHDNYCRIVDDYKKMRCTEIQQNDILNDYTVDLPFKITGKVGIEFNDIDGDGFDDLCRYDSSNNQVQCYLNENKKFSNDPISLALSGTPLVDLGEFSTKVIGARQSSSAQSAICYNVGFGSMRCDIFEIY